MKKWPSKKEPPNNQSAPYIDGFNESNDLCKQAHDEIVRELVGLLEERLENRRIGLGKKGELRQIQEGSWLDRVNKVLKNITSEEII